MHRLCQNVLAQHLDCSQLQSRAAPDPENLRHGEPIFESIDRVSNQIVFRSDLPSKVYRLIINDEALIHLTGVKHDLAPIQQRVIQVLSAPLPDIIEQHEGRANHRGQRYYSTTEKLAEGIERAWRNQLLQDWNLVLNCPPEKTREIMIQLLEEETQRQQRIQECQEIIRLEQRHKRRSAAKLVKTPKRPKVEI